MDCEHDCRLVRCLERAEHSSMIQILEEPLALSYCFEENSLGTLRSEDGDGRENVAEKVNSRSFNLHYDYSKYSKSLTLSNVGEPS